jgi:hypothetical protein
LAPEPSGDASDQTLSTEQKTFVERYADAIRAKDVARLKTFVHPGSLACITPDSAEFFDGHFGASGPQRLIELLQAEK